ncbi:MAG TPA: porin [Vicinamibacterales bacterium]|nr:porin [Vicinamibacterales bacterium]
MTIKSGSTFILRLGVLLLCLIAPSFALAQDQPKPPDATPPPPDPDKVTLNFFKGTEIGGLVDVYWLYNSNHVAPLYQAFDTLYNSFDVSMAEVWLAKSPTTDSPIGYKIRTTFGSAADLMASASGQFAKESPYKNIEEAYGSYMAPVGKGLQIDVGKFVTNAGAEVIEAKDDWNYSRSLLFQLAIPLYHAGVRLTYSPNDKVTLMGGVINGWNDVNDNNTGKSVMASITYKPNGSLSLIENYITGPEQPNDNSDWRNLSDTVISYTVNPALSVQANYDYTTDTVSNVRTTTQGIAGYLKYQANKWVALVPRLEYFHDANGAPWATGIPGQNLTDATVTLEVKPADNFMWRIEYRGDFSNKSPFINADGVAKSNQQLFMFGFLYNFSSKL